MKYMGSKARIAKDIVPIINRLIKENNIDIYIEPFVGGANLIQHIECPMRFGYDNNHYLIAFLKAIQRGWNPLQQIQMTKDVYQDIKQNPDKYAPEVVALAGFCATYNAKWFGGYAGTVKTKIGTFRNYYDEAVRNVLKQAEKIRSVEFNVADFTELHIANTLIYCDPPYQETTGYKDTFDHEKYWDWVRKMSAKNIVLCSEYSAPPDFECIWSKQLTTTLDKNSRSKSVEKLFVFKKERKKEMELKVKTPTFPEVIEFNFEELRQEITNKASEYINLVYSADQIQDAKKDVATLRKFTKALSDERIKIKKECLKPYEDFEAKIKELDGIVGKAIQNIDGQVKAADEKKKAERKQAIVEYWTNTEIQLPIPLTLEQIFNEKWLNASVSIKTVCAEIDARLEQIEKDLATLRNLPEFAFEAIEEYKQSLDLNKAITEGHRLSEIQKRKAEAEKITIPPLNVEKPTDEDSMAIIGTQPEKMWISFKAHLSVDDAQALKSFFESRNIEFMPL